MAFVKQKSKVDCGVAALAMLCDVTYGEAKAAILWPTFDPKKNILCGTTTRMLRAAAAGLGYTTKSTPQNRLKIIKAPDVWIGTTVGGEIWNFIPENSLVKIPGKFGWHWVVWRKGKIYDPARGVFLPRKYDHIPTSYMEFVRCVMPKS